MNLLSFYVWWPVETEWLNLCNNSILRLLILIVCSWTSSLLFFSFPSITYILWTLFLLIQQWAGLYQPLTFHGDSLLDTPVETFLNKLDPDKAFRGKIKTPAPKKKQPSQAPSSGGPAKGRGSRAGKTWRDNHVATGNRMFSLNISNTPKSVKSAIL